MVIIEQLLITGKAAFSLYPKPGDLPDVRHAAFAESHESLAVYEDDNAGGEYTLLLGYLYAGKAGV